MQVAQPPPADHEGPLQLLGPLVVSGVQVHAVQPGVHAGVAKALHAQHCLLGGAEHGEGLVVELALGGKELLGARAEEDGRHLPVELLGLLAHVDDVVLAEHLAGVSVVPAGPAQGLACITSLKDGSMD